MPGSSSPTRADCRVGPKWRVKEAARGARERHHRFRRPCPIVGPGLVPSLGSLFAEVPSKRALKAGRRKPPPRTATSGSAQAAVRFRGVLRHVGCDRLGSHQAPTGQPRDTDLEPVRRASPRRGPPTERQSRGHRPPPGASPSVAARIHHAAHLVFGRGASRNGSARSAGRDGSAGLRGEIGRVPISLTKTEAAAGLPLATGGARGLGHLGKGCAAPAARRFVVSSEAAEGDGRLGCRSGKGRCSSKRLREELPREASREGLSVGRAPLAKRDSPDITGGAVARRALPLHGRSRFHARVRRDAPSPAPITVLRADP